MTVHISGRVVRGAGRGKALGIPTANIVLDGNAIIPADGVYVGWAIMEEKGAKSKEKRGKWKRKGKEIPATRRYAAAISVGRNITFDATERTVEAHLLDYNGTCYGQTIRLEFVSRLRDMMRFDSTEELVHQIQSDIEKTRTSLRDYSLPVTRY
jgi:riboflavin kinase / FMN adenylyltransferase